MGYVSQGVRAEMEKRVKDAVQVIASSGLDYEEIGVFGSYARDEYTALSDVDICVITSCTNRRTLAFIRDEFDERKYDILFVTREGFATGESRLYKNLRRDYRRVSVYGQK